MCSSDLPFTGHIASRIESRRASGLSPFGAAGWRFVLSRRGDALFVLRRAGLADAVESAGAGRFAALSGADWAPSVAAPAVANRRAEIWRIIVTTN
mgnify:CR=1 FL=1